MGQPSGEDPQPEPSALHGWENSRARPGAGGDDRVRGRLKALFETRPTAGVAWGFAAFFLGCGTYYLVSFVLGVLVPEHRAAFDPAAPPELGPLLLLAFVPNMTLGLIPALFSWRRGNGLRADFGLIPTWREVKIGFACGGSALVASGLVAVVLVSVSGAPPQSAIDGLMEQDRSIWLVLFALFAFLGAPLTEELLVRGALWGAFEHHQVPRYAILLLTALIFALLHAEPWRMPVLFVGGVALGAARMITGGIGASMVAHATNNFLPALVLILVAR